MLHSLDKNKSFYIDTIPLHSETCAYGLVRTTSHAIVYPLGCYKADELCLSENLHQKVRLFEILLNSILFCLLFFQQRNSKANNLKRLTSLNINLPIRDHCNRNLSIVFCIPFSVNFEHWCVYVNIVKSQFRARGNEAAGNS